MIIYNHRLSAFSPPLTLPNSNSEFGKRLKNKSFAEDMAIFSNKIGISRFYLLSPPSFGSRGKFKKENFPGSTPLPLSICFQRL
jgi:hypothetical protein